MISHNGNEYEKNSAFCAWIIMPLKQGGREATKLEPISQAKAEESSSCAEGRKTVLSLYPTTNTSKIQNILKTKT